MAMSLPVYEPLAQIVAARLRLIYPCGLERSRWRGGRLRRDRIWSKAVAVPLS